MNPLHTINSKNCWLQIQTPLPDHTLLLWQIEGSEGFSRLFSYRLTLLSAKSDLKPEQLIGKTVTITFQELGKSLRFIQGHLINLSINAIKLEGFYVYQAEIAPWLWFLTQAQNSRIFQNKNCLAIIKEVLDTYKFSYDASAVQDNYPTLDYCVQFQETDFNFLARLLEQAGIFYYFKHSQDGHSLILANQQSGYDQGEAKSVKLAPVGGGQPHIQYWHHHYHYSTGSWQNNAHDFKNPDQTLSGTAQGQLQLAHASLCQNQEYLGDYQLQLQVDTVPKQRLAELETRYSQISAGSNYADLAVGSRLEPTANTIPGEPETQCVISELSLKAVENSYLSSNQAILPAYQNEFVALPATTVFYPQRITPKPRPTGVQEALVTGPSGEAIYADSFGRLKVKFAWDQASNKDETSSCWLRCLRSWEGLLRVGTPVLVDFIDGDIDKPYIVGPIDDGKQKPLYDPQQAKTVSGLKRRPGTEDNDQHYNEICFEDKKDQEKLSIKAGKDMNVNVPNDYQADILHDEKRNVTNDRLTTIKEGNDTLNIDNGNLVITIKNGAYTIQANGNVTIEAGGDLKLKAGGDIKLEAGNAAEFKTGTSLDLNSGTSLAINSGTSLAVSSGTSLSQDAGTTLAMSASIKASLKGALTDINSDGMLKIQGTLVKVN